MVRELPPVAMGKDKLGDLLGGIDGTRSVAGAATPATFEDSVAPRSSHDLPPGGNGPDCWWGKRPATMP